MIFQFILSKIVRQNISLLLQRNKKYHINLYFNPIVSSGANTRASGLLNSSAIDRQLVFIRYEESNHDHCQPNEVILNNRFNSSIVLRVLVVYVLQIFLRHRVCVVDVFPMLPLKNHYYLVHDIGNYIAGVRRSQAFRACVFKFHLKLVRNIVTVSAYTSKILRHLGFLNNIIISYNALDDNLQKLATPDNITLKKRKIDFLFVTSGAHHKRDVELLSFISKYYPDKNVSIAGRYNGFADEFLNNYNIVIHDNPSYEELASLYKNSKVYVSYSRHEGYGITVLEAIAFGCNCVITKIPVFVELYKGYSCVSFLPIHNNTEKIKDVLDQSLSPSQADESINKNSTYNWDNIYRKLIKDLGKNEN